ncbi:hypothetical protein [Chroococcidiopsis cubana]|uniref:hypothetical protein n=1 Tax=Chroococcidiopsis cubana TaxID=171392 RepID=UPI000F8CCA70|nr:hypothetical protein [Chroococcidiopsis cubana]
MYGGYRSPRVKYWMVMVAALVALVFFIFKPLTTLGMPLSAIGVLMGIASPTVSVGVVVPSTVALRIRLLVMVQAEIWLGLSYSLTAPAAMVSLTVDIGDIAR